MLRGEYRRDENVVGNGKGRQRVRGRGGGKKKHMHDVHTCTYSTYIRHIRIHVYR